MALTAEPIVKRLLCTLLLILFGELRMADIASFLAGAVVGFIVGALVFTVTGREVTGGVTRAAGARVERYIRPK